MKNQIVKLSNDCTLKLSFLDKFGRPIKLNDIASLVCRLNRPGSLAQQTPSASMNLVNNEVTVALTYASNLTAEGEYILEFVATMYDGTVLNAGEMLVKVEANTVSAATSFHTTMIFDGYYDFSYVNHKKEVADGGTVVVKDGDVITGTAIDAATFSYDVNDSFNAVAFITFKSGATTHAMTFPASYKKTVTPSTAANKTYMFKWENGVLVMASEVS